MAGVLPDGTPEGRAHAAAAARVAREVYGFPALAEIAQGASISSTPVMQLV